MGRLERNGGFGPAFGAGGACFGTYFLISAQPLRLALFATLGVVFEFLVLEKDLLACGENEFGAAVNAREYSISEFHGRLPWSGDITAIGLNAQDRRSRFPDSDRDTHTEGPGPHRRRAATECLPDALEDLGEELTPDA